MYTTLLDLAQRSGTNGLATIVDGIGELAPELTKLPSKTIKGTTVRVPIRRGVPRLYFRMANGGTPLSKAKYETKLVEAFNLSDIIKIDVQVADEADGGRGEVMTEAVLAHGKGGLQSLGWQNIYGTKFDALGFPGIYEQMDDYQTISANPLYNEAYLKTPANMKIAQADNTGTSALLICLGNDYLYQFWGNSRVMQFGAVREQVVTALTADGKEGYMNALVRSMDSKAGLALANPRAVARIKNITAENALTDDLLKKAEQCLPLGAKYIIITSKEGAYTLHEWRRKNGVIQVASGFTGAVATGRNLEFLGMEILPTTSILADETDASIKAVANEAIITKKRVTGTIQ